MAKIENFNGYSLLKTVKLSDFNSMEIYIGIIYLENTTLEHGLRRSMIVISATTANLKLLLSKLLKVIFPQAKI